MRCELLSTACDQASTSQVAYTIYLHVNMHVLTHINGLIPFFGLFYASLLQSFVPVALIVKFQYIFLCQLSISQKNCPVVLIDDVMMYIVH